MSVFLYSRLIIAYNVKARQQRCLAVDTGPPLDLLRNHDATKLLQMDILGKPLSGWAPLEGFTVPPSALHLIDLLLYFL